MSLIRIKIWIMFCRTIVRQYSWAANIDDFVYLTFRNNQPGTVGMGYVGTVCDDDVTARTNLCEYLNDDLTSGHVSQTFIFCLETWQYKQTIEYNITLTMTWCPDLWVNHLVSVSKQGGAANSYITWTMIDLRTCESNIYFFETVYLICVCSLLSHGQFC